MRAAPEFEHIRLTRWAADRARLNLGTCPLDQGRVDEAEPLIRESIHRCFGISERLKQVADEAVARLNVLLGLTPS